VGKNNRKLMLKRRGTTLLLSTPREGEYFIKERSEPFSIGNNGVQQRVAQGEWKSLSISKKALKEVCVSLLQKESRKIRLNPWRRIRVALSEPKKEYQKSLSISCVEGEGHLSQIRLKKEKKGK